MAKPTDPFGDGDGLGDLPEMDLRLIARQQDVQITLSRLGTERTWIAKQAGQSGRGKTILDALIKLAGINMRASRCSDQPRWNAK